MGKVKPAGVGKKRGGGKRSSLTLYGGMALFVGLIYFASTIFFKTSSRFNAPLAPSKRQTSERPSRGKKPTAQKPIVREADVTLASKHDSLEWRTLSRDVPACLSKQDELMTIPVEWPGFHALCIDDVGGTHVAVRLHGKSTAGEPSVLRAEPALGDAPSAALVNALLARLQSELGPREFRQVDPMVSTSAYDFPPNPWKLFTEVGGPVEFDEDLRVLGRGAAVFLYTGGQFIWPGVRLGHKTRVPIPVTDGSAGGHKTVEMTTVSLRPTVFVLSDFLTDAECAFIKKCAYARHTPPSSPSARQPSARHPTATAQPVRAHAQRAHAQRAAQSVARVRAGRQVRVLPHGAVGAGDDGLVGRLSRRPHLDADLHGA